MKLESIEHARFRALAQILVSKEHGTEAFDEYMKIAFPYLEASKRRSQEQAIKMLEQEIKRGPFAISAQQQPVLKSKMQSRILSRKKPQTREEADALYRRMGGAMPI
jgi:hypothetical protein